MGKISEAKRNDFLRIVQTTLIANSVNICTSSTENRKSLLHEASGLGVKNEMCDAVKASYLIPVDMDYVEAADEYLSWKIWATRESKGSDDMPSGITPGLQGWDR